MEPGKGREVGRKGAENSRERVEKRWGERSAIRRARFGHRESASRAGRPGENEEERGRERGKRRDSRSQGEIEEETGKRERRNWGTGGLPKVKGARISTWSQPSSSLWVPWGFKKEEEAAGGRRSGGGWSSQRCPLHPPETTPTRPPRTQQDVEALSGSTSSTPSMHREAGTELSPSVSLSVRVSLCVWAGVGSFFVHCVVALACTVASSESLAFRRESRPDS